MPVRNHVSPAGEQPDTRTTVLPGAFLLAFALVVPPATAQPPAQPAKSAWLDPAPTDSFAFLTVNVAKLWDKPGFKPLRDWLDAQKTGPSDTIFGVRAAEVDRITAFMANWDPDDGVLWSCW